MPRGNKTFANWESAPVEAAASWRIASNSDFILHEIRLSDKCGKSDAQLVGIGVVVVVGAAIFLFFNFCWFKGERDKKYGSESGCRRNFVALRRVFFFLLYGKEFILQLEVKEDG